MPLQLTSPTGLAPVLGDRRLAMRGVHRLLTMGLLAVLGCAPEDTTGYTLNINTDFVGQELPTQLVISCFVGDTITVNEERYPKGRTPLGFAVGRVAQIGIDADPEIVGERRFWVRAVRASNMAVLAEAVEKAPTAVSGKRLEIDMLLSWTRLPDEDKDGVPDEIDNCPLIPNENQAACPSDNEDAGGNPLDAGGAMDAARIDVASPKPQDAAAFDTSVF